MRFNTIAPTRHKTTNLAGGEAFVQDPKMELASLLLTSFVQDQFYRDANAQIVKVKEMLFSDEMNRFGAKAAIYARNEFGMRSITHVLAGEVAKNVKGKEWTKHFFNAVVRRPDDVTEILSYYMSQYGKPIPNALKKGLGLALSRFDEYRLGKYKSARAALSLVDAVNLVRPKHTEAIGKLVNGTLEAPNTWEVRLTQAGSDAEAKAEVWRDLITTEQLGYFALLRNLRNIAEQSPGVLDVALEQLTDDDRIRKSLVLPFRFTTAIEQMGGLERSRDVIVALNTAVDISLSNVPRMDGKTLVIVDSSGSMTWGGQGDKRPIKIATLFASVLVKANDADLMLFDGDARYLGVNPMDSTLTIAGQIESHAKGGATNFHAPLITAKRAYERMIFLSDMQGWVGYNAPTSTLEQYKARTGANPHVYSFDLQGYGSLQFPQDRLYCMAGFSEKVFDAMALLEKNRNALIDTIESVEL